MRNLTESEPFNSRFSACGLVVRKNCPSVISSHPGRGYMEDRRPAANCDPYAVTKRILQTCGEAIVTDLGGTTRAPPDAKQPSSAFCQRDTKRDAVSKQKRMRNPAADKKKLSNRRSSSRQGHRGGGEEGGEEGGGAGAADKGAP